jgi:uncharacterized protein
MFLKLILQVYHGLIQISLSMTRRAATKLISFFLSIICFSYIGIYFFLRNLENTINIGLLSSFIDRNIYIITAIIVLIASLGYLFVQFLKEKLKKIYYILVVFLNLLSASCFITVFFYIGQDELIYQNNIIFEPYIGKGNVPGNINAEKITINVEQGINLKGWLLKNAQIKKAPLIIYFGGSGQEVSGMWQLFINEKQFDIALINYRGFGNSDGIENEKNAYSDSLKIYDYFINRIDIDKNNIFVAGYSIGTAFVAELSAKRNLKGAIMLAPISRLDEMLQPKIKWIPLKLFLKQKMNTIERAKNAKCPLLCIIGTDDPILEYSMKTYNNWNGEKRLLIKEGWDHISFMRPENKIGDIICGFASKIILNKT